MVKNWLGRKGLHYIESLTEVEKQACGTLQGLIDTLAKKFRPQYNETINSDNYVDMKGKMQRNGWGGYE